MKRQKRIRIGGMSIAEPEKQPLVDFLKSNRNPLAGYLHLRYGELSDKTIDKICRDACQAFVSSFARGFSPDADNSCQCHLMRICNSMALGVLSQNYDEQTLKDNYPDDLKSENPLSLAKVGELRDMASQALDGVNDNEAGKTEEEYQSIFSEVFETLSPAHRDIIRNSLYDGLDDLCMAKLYGWSSGKEARNKINECISLAVSAVLPKLYGDNSADADPNDGNDNELLASIGKFVRNKLTDEETKQLSSLMQESKHSSMKSVAFARLADAVQRMFSENDKSIASAARVATADDVDMSLKVDDDTEKGEKGYFRTIILPFMIAMLVAVALIANRFILANAAQSFMKEKTEELLYATNRGYTITEDDKKLNSLFNYAYYGEDIVETVTELRQRFYTSLKSGDDPIKTTHLGWFLAVGYLRMGDTPSAKVILKQVVENDPNAYDAEQLLKKLNKHICFLN